MANQYLMLFQTCYMLLQTYYMHLIIVCIMSIPLMYASKYECCNDYSDSESDSSSDSDSSSECDVDTDDEVKIKKYNYESSLGIKGLVTFNCLNCPVKNMNNDLYSYLKKYDRKFNELENKYLYSESELLLLNKFEMYCLNEYPDIHKKQIDEIENCICEIKEEMSNVSFTKNEMVLKLNEAKTTSSKFNNKIAEMKVYEKHIENCNKTLKSLEINLNQGNNIIESLRKEIDTPIFIQKQNEYVSKTSMQLLISEKLKSLSNNYVFDTIPNYGMIIMKYNAKTNTFEYFCNTSLPYNITEAVCKKYMITYKCKPLFIDYQNNIKELKEKELKENKSNNKHTTKPSTQGLENLNDIMLRFLQIGILRDFNILQSKTYKPLINEHLTYETFKNLNSSMDLFKNSNIDTNNTMNTRNKNNTMNTNNTILPINTKKSSNEQTTYDLTVWDDGNVIPNINKSTDKLICKLFEATDSDFSDNDDNISL